MFVGHLAVALGAKAAAPRIPLATLVAAAFALDLLWPIFALAGVEHFHIDPGNTAFTPIAFDSYPWSHSLVMSIVWGVVLAIVTSSRASMATQAIVAGTVVSHWILDFVSHRPDMPLWPGSGTFGLGLWNNVGLTFLVEGLFSTLAILAYRAACPERDAVGRWSFAGLVVFTGAIWISGPFSPPPPSVTAVAIVGLALWILPVWAAWIDRHRSPRRT